MTIAAQPTSAPASSLSPDEIRRRFVMGHCPNHLRGLELAPSLPTIVDRGTFDVASVGLPGREIPTDIRSDADIDWHDGRSLAECAEGRLFGYAIASHILQQMPDPLGWVRQVLECLEDGGRFAILLPHRERSINHYRQNTTFAQVMAWAIEKPSVPTPMQVMDFLSQSFEEAGETDYAVPMPDFSAMPRHYTDAQAVDFARLSWNEGQRLDVHCTTWTPESFAEVFSRLIGVGMLEARIVDLVVDVPELSSREFLVVLEKTNSVRGRHAK